MLYKGQVEETFDDDNVVSMYISFVLTKFPYHYELNKLCFYICNRYKHGTEYNMEYFFRVQIFWIKISSVLNSRLPDSRWRGRSYIVLEYNNENLFNKIYSASLSQSNRLYFSL